MQAGKSQQLGYQRRIRFDALLLRMHCQRLALGCTPRTQAIALKRNPVQDFLLVGRWGRCI